MNTLARSTAACEPHAAGAVRALRIFALAALLVAGGLSLPAHPQTQAPPPAQTQAPQPPDLARLADRTEVALRWGDMDELERLLHEARTPGARMPDGNTPLAAFDDGLSRYIDASRLGSQYLSELEAWTLAQAQARPQSALAQVLHAKVLVAHAWWYRGNGFAKTVSPEGMREFKTRLQQAAAYLAAHADVAMRETLAHRVLITIGRGLDWPIERQWAIASDGLKLDPSDDELYFAALIGTLPKWGGTPKTVDDLIGEALARTRATRGYEMYARLYALAAYQDFDLELFNSSLADWSLMKQGYLDLLSRHDTQLRHNQFAFFACAARDKATFLDQLARLGDKPDLSVWGSNAAANFEACKRWAASS